jgi:hypothetical protein
MELEEKIYSPDCRCPLNICKKCVGGYEKENQNICVLCNDTFNQYTNVYDHDDVLKFEGIKIMSFNQVGVQDSQTPLNENFAVKECSLCSQFATTTLELID